MAKTHRYDGWRRPSFKLPKEAFAHLDALVKKADVMVGWRGCQQLKAVLIEQALKTMNEGSPADLQLNLTPVIRPRVMNGERHLRLVPSTQKKQED
jgi:hypothetical protein